MDKFTEEAKHLAKFQNEIGIVKVFDSFVENETAYIIMEFLDGETLTSRLKRDPQISEDEAIEMLLPVMNSLKNVHAEGTIWECFESTTNATESNTGCYKFVGHSYHSWWWFKITVYKQTYTDYQKVYNYKKVTSCTNQTEVCNGGEISNVNKYIQYREK